MTEIDITELHAQALDAAGRIVAGIPADRWQADTPCEGWDVRALLNHVVLGNLWAAELGAGARSRAWAIALTATCSARTRPALRHVGEGRGRGLPQARRVDAPCAVSYGPVPGSVYAGHRFLDVFIHGWNLAAATGQDTTLDPDLMQACREVIEPQVEAFRSAGALGAPLPVPPARPTRRVSWLCSDGQDDAGSGLNLRNACCGKATPRSATGSPCPALSPAADGLRLAVLQLGEQLLRPPGAADLPLARSLCVPGAVRLGSQPMRNGGRGAGSVMAQISFSRSWSGSETRACWRRCSSHDATTNC